MAGCVLRTLLSEAGLWVAAAFVPGIDIEGVRTLLGAALLLGVANAVVRPVLVVLTFPITVETLGLYLLVINAAMLGLVAALLQNFAVAGFLPAVLGSIVVSLVSSIGSWYIGPRGRVELMVVERRR